MTSRRIDTWVWVLIYLGMILIGLGLSLLRGDAALGWIIASIGAALVVAGIVLIWMRSRMKS